MSTAVNNNCSQCGAPLEANTRVCKYCGSEVLVQQVQGVQYTQNQGGYTQPQVQPYMQPQTQPYVQPQNQQYIPPQAPQYNQPVYNPNVKVKNKLAAGLLAIFLGTFGAHKFYLGKPVQGIIYLLFCWTYIPGIIGFIEGIVYLASNEEKFHYKYDKR